MKPMSKIVLAVLVSAAVAAPAVAQNLAKERGKIVSANWQTMVVEIKDPQDRVGTWKVRRDATVTFTDKKSDFPNPKLADLRPPMYVYFTFDADTKIVQRLRGEGSRLRALEGRPGHPAEGRHHQPRREHRSRGGEHGGGPEDLRGGPQGPAPNFKIGDRVTILIETREGREVVTLVKRVGSESTQAGSASRGTASSPTWTRTSATSRRYLEGGRHSRWTRRGRSATSGSVTASES